MEIGTKLKEARVAQNLSLESVQETTKIQKRYLIAIEEGNFNVLPGKFYARAFIKEYAAAVGLDPNELLDEYKEEVPKAEDENTEQYTRIQRSRRDSNSPRNTAIFSIFPTIIVILLIIGIIFAAWYFISKSSGEDPADQVDTPDNNEIIYDPGESTQDETQGNNETTDETPTEEEQPETPTDEPEADAVEPTLELVEAGSGTSPESTFDLNNASEEVKVVLESDGNSYLAMSNEAGEQYFAGPFSAEISPKEIDVSDDERIYFNIGNAPDLTITIDGVTLEYPVDANEYVHQKIWININPKQE